MGEPYEVRWAKESDWSPTMKMIWRTFLKYDSVDYTKEGYIGNYVKLSSEDVRKIYSIE